MELNRVQEKWRTKKKIFAEESKQRTVITHNKSNIIMIMNSNHYINKCNWMLSAFNFSTADMLNNVAEQQILRLRPWFRFTTMRVLLLAGLAVRQYSRPCFLNLQCDRPVIIRTLAGSKTEQWTHSLFIGCTFDCELRTINTSTLSV